MSDQVLDVIERLLVAAHHPDIVKVERYGPGEGPWGPTKETSRTKHLTGVKVTYQSTATASLWEAIWPDEQQVDPPATTLPPERRALRLLVFTAHLLGAARPAQVRAWRLVALPGLGLEEERGIVANGLSVAMLDGSRVLLRASSTGATLGDEPDDELFPDYVIPQLN